VDEKGKLPSALMDGLVLYYDCNQGDGDRIPDKSGNGNDGMVLGARWTDKGVHPIRTARGPICGAYELDGVDDLLKLDGGSHSVTTLAVWFRLKEEGERWSILLDDPTGADYGRIYGSPGVWLDKQKVLVTGGFHGGWNPIVSSEAFRLHKWHHIAAVFQAGNPGQIALFLDGELSGEGKRYCHRLDLREAVIGARPSKGGIPGYLHGSVDEVMVWGRALSKEEINQVYEITR